MEMRGHGTGQQQEFRRRHRVPAVRPGGADQNLAAAAAGARIIGGVKIRWG